MSEARRRHIAAESQRLGVDIQPAVTRQEPPQPLLRAVSFGGGVQSTAILALILDGTLERPDALLFADTGWEPAAVYAHVAWCEAQCAEARLPFYRVSAGNIRADALGAHGRAPQDEGGARSASLPFFTANPDGSGGILRRQCTGEYKLRPLDRKARELAGAGRGERLAIHAVEMWLGISTDELRRARISRDRWKVHRFPLIERRMNRVDCLLYLERAGWLRPPRSACIGCPFHSNAEWRAVQSRPEEWEDACEFDAAIRHKGGVRGAIYLHRSLRPLAEVDLRDEEDHGQQSAWREECMGLCDT